MKKIKNQELVPLKDKPLTLQEFPLARKRLNRDEANAVKFIIKTLRIDPKTARALLFQDERRARYLKYQKMALDIDLVETVRVLQKAVKEKSQEGKMTDARNGAFALGILRTKLFEHEKEAKENIIVTEGIKVRLSFPWKPKYSWKTANTEKTLEKSDEE